MESIQQIKSRIDSIAGTRQITQSMRMVSTSRLRVVRERLQSNAVFFDENTRLVEEAASEYEARDCQYVRRPGSGAGGRSDADGHADTDDASAKCFIVVGGDRGLCGGYNINICRMARDTLKPFRNVRLITVGQKIGEYFTRRSRAEALTDAGSKIVKSYAGISETPFFEDAEEIAALALGLFNRKEADSISIIYTKFVNMLNLKPALVSLLPLSGEKPAGPDRLSAQTRYEPDCAGLLEQAVPFWAASAIFGAILESSVCEQCSRIMSMDSAVNNSGKMMEALTLKYNQARQGAVTSELADIIGGTKALKDKLERADA